MFKNDKKKIAPIFITGVWRSGTTLTSRILNNHPDLSITYDTVHFLRFSYNKYNPIKKRKNVKKLIFDVQKRLLDRYQIKISSSVIFKNIKGDYKYSKIYDSIMKNLLLKNTNKIIWGEKTNLAWTKIPDFFKMYPNGRVIHLIRDPRATLSSWKKFTEASGNKYLDSILNSYNSMKSAIKYKNIYKDKKYLIVRYEDLVVKPKITIKQICNKLEINYDSTMLNTKIFKDIRGNKWKSNSIYKKNLDGISSVAIDRWKKNLKTWEIYLTNNILGDLLDIFKYKKTKVLVNQNLINKTFHEIKKCKFVSDGILQFSLGTEGFERYPSNPLIKSNWSKRSL
mgnify:CR=1 FL=1